MSRSESIETRRFKNLLFEPLNQIGPFLIIAKNKKKEAKTMLLYFGSK